MYYITTMPLLPLRAEASEKAEMVSQLLFGEQIEIIEREDKWIYARNMSDNYYGWLSESAVDKLYITDEPLENKHFTRLCATTTICFKTSSVTRILLPGGSLLPPIQNDQFQLAGEIYQLAQLEPVFAQYNPRQLVIELALQYQNAPYLWGGKSILGIDCSGFTQVVYQMAGYQIPRDASEQAQLGNNVNFLSESKIGDLAFFENDEKRIIHVGIIINSHQLIHASGSVKIEILDAHGIISSQTGKYTHKLRVVKRVIP